ncbi:MAG: DUF1343 domain-containing protein [Ignavibacteriales bacterium]|nr:DUF1343 domain-containing protein [Ignavibacteriales bacterium]
MRTILFLILIAAAGSMQAQQVKSGADVLMQSRQDLLRGKRIGLITNHSALLADGRHLADAIRADSAMHLVALFGPEHGIRGDAPDGKSIQTGTDPKTGVPVFSLYGKVSKPTAEMLKKVDVLVYDIQDVGARFYTFISTLFLTMEAAAEFNIPYVVLDRPNPIRGVSANGPIREDSLKSFVGWAPMPISHGMTVGELATMANGTGWLHGAAKANLTVVRMEGWNRNTWYDETGLRWVKPSPNMATLRTATVYPGTCLFEGTNLSEGRGSEKPFEYIGSPFMENVRWRDALIGLHLPGVMFDTVSFVPVEIANAVNNPKYKGQLCRGVAVSVTDRNVFEPVLIGVAMVKTAHDAAPNDFQFRDRRFDLLAGSPRVRLMINAGKSVEEIAGSWKVEAESFRKARMRYLLYP